jgi:hypothetical protein
MNSESLTNVLTRQWRIVTGSETVNPRNRMPESGASGSVGAPLEESGALPGNGLLPLDKLGVPSIYSVSRLSRRRSALGRLLSFALIALRSFLATVSQSRKSHGTLLGKPTGGWICILGGPWTQ